MLRRLILSSAFILAAAAPAMAQCDTRFQVVNRTPVVMNEFYFRVTGTPGWGADRFGADVLAAGRSYNLDTRAPGRHDFRIVAASGQSVEVSGVDICVTSRIVADEQGLKAE